jgi:hypothetical protein
MKMSLVAVLSVGIGWILGTTIMMIFVPLGGSLDYSIGEAMGNTLVFGFPGFVMFMIALILSIRDDANEI